MAQQINITTEAMKTAPPAIVALFHAGGMTPSDWVTVLTLTYLALQIGLLVPRYWQQIQDWRETWAGYWNTFKKWRDKRRNSR